jgi:hypothetical protein
MGKPVQRKTDANSANGEIDDTKANTTVFANGLLVSIDGSQGTADDNHDPDSPGDAHDVHVWTTEHGSHTVFAHNTPVNFTDNPDSCEDVRVGGSSNVFVGDDIDVVEPVAIALFHGDEEDAVNPGGGITYMAAQVAAGNVSAEELQRAVTVVPGETDTKAPAQNTPLSTDCSDIDSLDPFPSGNTIDTIQLTAHYTVGSLTRSPSVTFDHALRGNVGSLSLKEIVCNLKLLAVNCIEPIKAQYSNMIVTNTWRPIGIGSATSQHPKGQACDMQFRGIGNTAYFDIAKWIKDAITFDQLLLEYKTTGSQIAWIHVSFNSAHNRKMVLTMMNDRVHSHGLTQLA